MNWTRLAAVVIGTGVASSLTKWFFAGDWLHLRWDVPGNLARRRRTGQSGESVLRVSHAAEGHRLHILNLSSLTRR